MVALREDFIHYHVRAYLRSQRWLLLAGQYPGGSDDELSPLFVVDPELARDNSPDPRRHSANKLVPDLVALRQPFLLVTEMKPEYNALDEMKLLTLRAERQRDFQVALRALAGARGIDLPAASDTRFVPCLGFSAGLPYPRRGDFAYIFVDEEGEVDLDGNGLVGDE